MFVLTPEQMRAVDALAAQRMGEVELMRNAGARIAELIERHARGPRIVAFAGPGNNGGDAFAAFAELDASYERHIYAQEDERSSSPARRDAELRAHDAGVHLHPLPQNETAARAAIGESGLVLDALFGTGARVPLPPQYAAAIAAMNGSDAEVLAIDVPSGVDALTGATPGDAVRADVTLALGALKPGLLLENARAFVGALWCASIGIADAELATQDRIYAAVDAAELIARLPERPADSDKRRSGAPLLFAGSSQFPGAAILAARGAARAGAGYVTVVTSEAAAPALRAHLVEAVVVTIPESQSAATAVDTILDLANHATAFAVGPGLGLDERTGAIVRGVAERIELPFVADASALFHFAKHLELLRAKRCVLTPHAGEFARLSGKGSVGDGERVERLREFVHRTAIVTLLKGQSTLIYDGATMHVNTSGNNALATAGTGDVLTGIIATLLAQGLAPVDAARLGAYWHGLTGKRCAAERSRGVIAGDLPDALASALSEPPHPAGIVRVF